MPLKDFGNRGMWDYRNLLNRGLHYSGVSSGNPLLAGGIMAGAGALGGYLASPLIKYLYPETRNGKFSLAGALAAGIPAAALAYAFSGSQPQQGMPTPGAERAKVPDPKALATPTPATSKPGWHPPMVVSASLRLLNTVKSAAFGASGAGRPFMGTIETQMIRSALNPLITGGHVDPYAAAGFLGAVNMSSNNGVTTAQGVQRAAETAMGAVGNYLNPVSRLGFALAGTGASLATRALGVHDQVSGFVGRPVSEAMRLYGPGAQLLASGLKMIGGL